MTSDWLGAKFKAIRCVELLWWEDFEQAYLVLRTFEGLVGGTHVDTRKGKACRTLKKIKI